MAMADPNAGDRIFTPGELIRHAQRFTNLEGVTLDFWLDAEGAGKEDLAEQILEVGLDLEHIVSVLSPDFLEWPPEVVAHLMQLGSRFSALTGVDLIPPFDLRSTAILRNIALREAEAQVDRRKKSAAKTGQWYYDPVKGTTWQDI